MINSEINAGERVADDEHRYWPDVGQAPIAYYIRENLQDFIKRFEGIPPGVVRQQLRWVSEQLFEVKKANAAVEVAALCNPTVGDDSQLSDEMDRLDIEATTPDLRVAHRETLARLRESRTSTQA